MQSQQVKTGIIYAAILIGLLGIILQFTIMLQTRITPLPEAIIRFFSYFTILSNCMVIVFFIGKILPRGKKLNDFVNISEVATAVTIYIITVGVVYQTILRPSIPLQGLPRIADDILHALIPFIMLMYWILFISSKRINIKTIPYWLIYPAVYLMYTLLRGSMVHTYPYPFVNVNELGYSKVLSNSAMLVLFFLGLSYLFAGVANWRHKNKAVEDILKN
jgi:hypothetical protein